MLFSLVLKFSRFDSQRAALSQTLGERGFLQTISLLDVKEGPVKKSGKLPNLVRHIRNETRKFSVSLL